MGTLEGVVGALRCWGWGVGGGVGNHSVGQVLGDAGGVVGLEGGGSLVRRVLRTQVDAIAT